MLLMVVMMMMMMMGDMAKEAQSSVNYLPYKKESNNLKCAGLQSCPRRSVAESKSLHLAGNGQ